MSILLNEKTINKFNCKIIEFNPDATKFGNLGKYWPKKALQGVRVNSRIHTFRSLNITIIFYGDYKVASENISRFIEESSSAVFKYKDKSYDVNITEDDNVPVILNSNAVKLQLRYDVSNVYEAEKSTTTNSNTTITINSPKPCYANLEINSTLNSISCIVTVNDTEIKVNNIKGGETIYIGSGKVTAGGKSKINDVDIWEFPILKPGTNSIKVNRADVNLTIKYNERW